MNCWCRSAERCPWLVRALVSPTPWDSPVDRSGLSGLGPESFLPGGLLPIEFSP